MKTVIAVAALLLPIGAHAQSEGTAAPFVTTDRFERYNHVGVDLGIVTVENLDGQLYRLELNGHYVAPSGFGGYATAFLSLSNLDETFFFQTDESGLGNIDLGGLYMLPQGTTGSFDTGFRLGVVLPLASDEDADVHFIGMATRVTDLPVAVGGDTSWIRGSAFTTWTRGRLFARGDLGVDIVLGTDIDPRPDPFIRLNLALGGHVESVALTGELATLFNTDSSLDEQFLHNFAVSARYTGSAIQPHLAFVVLLDDSTSDLIDLAAIIGARYQL
jgi:hypothetical protein